MRLAELHPEWGVCPEVDGARALPHPTWWLIFDCPKCGAPKRIYVLFSMREQAAGVWRMMGALRAFPGLPGEHPDIESLTLVPSIGWPYHGRVERGWCSWHGNITNGEVTTS